MTAPVVTIGSALLLTIAIGRVPSLFISSIVYEPTVLPFPTGKANTLPAMLISSEPESRPVDGETPPRKLNGAFNATVEPLVVPLDIPLPLRIR
jgi:hypothetical protein